MACPDTQFFRGAAVAEVLTSETRTAGFLLHNGQDPDPILFEKMPGTTTSPRSPRQSSERSSGSFSRFTSSKGSIGSTTLTGSNVSIPMVKRRPSVPFGAPDQDMPSNEETWISDLHQRFGLQAVDQQNDSADAIFTPPNPRFARTNKAKLPQFRPTLRKTSSDNAPVSSDTPRSVAVPEGLGIRTDFKRDSEDGDPVPTILARRSISGFHHHRSVSGASQYSVSTTSSTNRPGFQHVHPMRKTPSCYTPPLSQSYHNSESEPSADTDESSSDTAYPRHSSLDLIRESVSSTDTAFQRPQLSILTRDNSLPKFTESSQNSIIGRRSFGHARDSSSALEAISPLSRSSLDFGFRSKTRTNTDPDPISRAATVQAARQAFEEKEAAKNRKYEKQQLKAQEKEQRRKEKKLLQRYQDADNLADATGSEAPVSEKSSEEEPRTSDIDPREPSAEQGRPAITSPTTGKSKLHPWKTKTRNTWVLFLTWLRTRLFKLTRKLRRSSQ